MTYIRRRSTMEQKYNANINFGAISEEKAKEIFELMLEAFCNQDDTVLVDNATLTKMVVMK